MSIKMDNLIKERHTMSKRHMSLTSLPRYENRNKDLASVSQYNQEPMEINTSHPYPEERAFRHKEGLWFYCCDKQHRIQSCPEINRSQSAWHTGSGNHSSTSLVSPSKVLAISPICLPVQVHLTDEIYLLSAVIDSGAAGNFIDRPTAENLQISLLRLENPPQACAIDCTTNRQRRGFSLYTHHHFCKATGYIRKASLS